MAEWSIASVLKTEGLKGSVGSNPTLSATLQNARIAQLVEHLTCNEDVVGSNPTAGSSLNKKYGCFSYNLAGEKANASRSRVDGDHPLYYRHDLLLFISGF